MRLITAVIKPFQLDAVKAALQTLGVHGMTVAEVRGHGRQRGHVEIYRGAEYEIDLISKIRLDVLVDDADLETIISTIASSARTGTIGDGKIWSTPVAELVRIRTGERDADAL